MSSPAALSTAPSGNLKLAATQPWSSAVCSSAAAHQSLLLDMGAAPSKHKLDPQTMYAWAG